MPTSPKLTPSLRRFIERQPLFFVATAAPTGRVNLSPKGMETLRVVDERRIRWLNLSGSGNETAAHLREDPRMTLMFCAFDGNPLILRVYGAARALHRHDADWAAAAADFPNIAGARQIFDLDIDLAQTSCGTGVPEMQVTRARGPDDLLPFYEAMSEDELRDYWRRKNSLSLDGRPTGVLEE